MLQINKWIAQLTKRQAALAKERDKLRQAIADMEDLEEVCKDACDSLDCAIARLSELV